MYHLSNLFLNVVKLWANAATQALISNLDVHVFVLWKLHLVKTGAEQDRVETKP